MYSFLTVSKNIGMSCTNLMECFYSDIDWFLNFSFDFNDISYICKNAVTIFLESCHIPNTKKKQLVEINTFFKGNFHNFF